MKEKGEQRAIIFLFVYVRRCVRWISVGGFCNRYFFVFSNFFCRMDEIFCIRGKMSDYSRKGNKGLEKKSDMDYNRGEMKESEGGKKAGDVRVEEGEIESFVVGM